MKQNENPANSKILKEPLPVMKQMTFKWPLLYLSLAKQSRELFKSKIKKKKGFPEFPGFELGNSDPIANHITTRPRSHYRI